MNRTNCTSTVSIQDTRAYVKQKMMAHNFVAAEYLGMSGSAATKKFGGILMCNYGFGGNNCWWIIILLLLLCNCGGNGICGSNNNGCGCDNNCGCC